MRALVGLFALMLVLGSAPRSLAMHADAEAQARSAIAAGQHCEHAEGNDRAAATSPDHGKGCPCCSADACTCASTSLAGIPVAFLISALPAAIGSLPVAQASLYATRDASPLRPPIG